MSYSQGRLLPCGLTLGWKTKQRRLLVWRSNDDTNSGTLRADVHIKKTIPMTEQENANKTGRRLLLAASTGGHLAQLVRLSDRLRAADASVWVTFDSPQSRSLLAGKEVLNVPYIAPRDYRGALNAFRIINSALRSMGKFDEAISTGAAIALPALCSARVNGIPTRYIESVSRTDGPSLSGKIIAWTRCAELETQHQKWANGRWKYRGTVLDSYQAVSAKKDLLPLSAESKIFVTLGTIRPYRFDSMIEAVLALGISNENSVWQVGVTNRNDLPGRVLESVSSEEFDELVRESDVTITHSGVGSIMRILDLGKTPVVIPRSSRRNEHVDDHQEQIAALLKERELGVVARAHELELSDIERARATTVIPGGEAATS